MNLQAILRRLLQRVSGTITPDSNAALTEEAFSERLKKLSAVPNEQQAIRLARHLAESIDAANASEQESFFSAMVDDYDPNPAEVLSAAQDFASCNSHGNLRNLIRCAEPKRQNILRRLNLAPDGTAVLVRLRSTLLDSISEGREFQKLDDDLLHLFRSWFSPGFLVLQKIDWSTPASILEKIIAYEAVHKINNWNELRRRLEPDDRMCFAFFHPAMPEEPLIFVEIALCQGLADSVDEILCAERRSLNKSDCDTAIFYSISNCQRGLSGISFGNVLIKMVAAEINKLIPGIKNFATLSPIPGLRNCLDTKTQFTVPSNLETISRADKEKILQSTNRYLNNQSQYEWKEMDPVARFHLGNGAIVGKLNWNADSSSKGYLQSYGIMVNYLYEMSHVDARELAFAENRAKSAGKEIVPAE